MPKSKKNEKAAALRELLGVKAKFERLADDELNELVLLFGNPQELAQRIAQGHVKEKVRAAFEGFSKEWKPGYFLSLLTEKD